MRGDWNILYHLGGNGPWIEKVDGVAHGGIGVPEGCRVEQVHMVRVESSSDVMTHNILDVLVHYTMRA